TLLGPDGMGACSECHNPVRAVPKADGQPATHRKGQRQAAQAREGYACPVDGASRHVGGNFGGNPENSQRQYSTKTII
ncbi:MAG: hypothetical protein ACREPL_05335, partial [Rhodanobacteraceae bacterium]